MENHALQRILIIEDDGATRFVLRSTLQRAGYAVQEAYDGAQGLLLARETAPAAIVLDLKLSGLGGFEIAKSLARSPHTAKIPFIFLTSNSDSVDRRSGLGLGASVYLSKPVNRGELLARLRIILDAA